MAMVPASTPLLPAPRGSDSDEEMDMAAVTIQRLTHDLVAPASSGPVVS